MLTIAIIRCVNQSGYNFEAEQQDLLNNRIRNIAE